MAHGRDVSRLGRGWIRCIQERIKKKKTLYPKKKKKKTKQVHCVDSIIFCRVVLNFRYFTLNFFYNFNLTKI